MNTNQFETRLLTNKSSNEFISWFEVNVQHEYEVKKHGDNAFIILCNDLNQDQIKECTEFEKTLFDGYLVEELAWSEALQLVMSEIPDIEEPVNAMMSQEIDELPEGFVVWEPFENWDLMGIQGLVEEMKDSLVVHSRHVLKVAGVEL